MSLSPLAELLSPQDDTRDFRHFLARVYLQVAAGVGLAGVIAWAISTQAPLQGLFLRAVDDTNIGFTGLGIVMVFAPLAIMLLASLGGGAGRAGSALLYWSVCATLGVSLSILAIGYADQSLASAFLTAAAAFCAMTLWGLTTQRNIAGWAGFLTLALTGLLIGWLAQAFLPNTRGNLLLDGAGVVVFALLVAVDGQRLKRIYRETSDLGAPRAAAVNMGALSLLLSFLNLFELFLSLTGRRRR